MPVFIEPEAVPAPRCERAGMTCVCLDEKRENVWLELTNYEAGLLKPPTKLGAIGCAHVGAVKAGSDWTLIPKPLKAKERHPIETDLPVEKVNDFHKAILTEWNKFTPQTAKEFAKGTTIGKSLTSPSFVAKALKTGYDAVGIKRDAYSGLKLGDWTIDNLFKYVQRMKSDAKPVDPLGFGDYAFDPRWRATELTGNDIGKIPQDAVYEPIRSGKPLSGKFAYDDFFKSKPGLAGDMERIVAYAFRGDTRPPKEIQDAGGMWPNYTRLDQNDSEKKNKKAEDEWAKSALNLGDHVEDEFLKGFISTTRSTVVAKKFAKADGFVYVVFVEGGFNCDESFTHKYEEEIAFPGGLDWDDIVGYRKLAGGRFTGSIYLKPAILKDEKPAVEARIIAALSGMELTRR